MKDTGTMLSNVYKIYKTHLTLQKVRGTDEDQGRGNIDPWDPNVPNFRDISLRNAPRAINCAPLLMVTCFTGGRYVYLGMRT